MKTFKINLIIFILTFSLLFVGAKQLEAQEDTNCKIPIEISPILYEPVGVVQLESDTTFLDGYLVFELHKKSDKYFDLGDTTASFLEVFFINDLSKINSIESRITYNTCYLEYASGYYNSFYPGYAVNKGVSVPINTTTPEYTKLRNFYREFIKIRDYHPQDYFLLEKMTSSMFDSTNSELFKLNDENLTYYVFTAKFSAGILKYKSEILLPGRKSLKESYVCFGTKNFFLPTSKAVEFKPIDESVMLKNGFTKSDWFPDYLYKKCK